MNRDDIIRMAREACGEPAWDGGVEWTWEEVERFAALVYTEGHKDGLDDFEAGVLPAAIKAERERINWDSIHSCHPECDKPVCVAMRKAVAEERESCAKLLDDLAAKDKLSNYYKVAALLIRERGAP
jgi:hypothetical protein